MRRCRANGAGESSFTAKLFMEVRVLFLLHASLFQNAQWEPRMYCHQRKTYHPLFLPSSAILSNTTFRAPFF